MALAPSVHNPAGNEGQAPTNMTPSAAGMAAAHGYSAPDYTPPSGGGGGGGGGNSTTIIIQKPPLLPPGDYSGLLGLAGLPQDVIDEINRIFANSYDIGSATALALAYVRGTPWYAQTYPGINEGIKNGLVSDERGYRAYMNSLNQVYGQYFNRSVSGDEVAAALREGVSPDIVGRRFQGDAIVKANSGDWQYLAGAFDESGRFGSADLTALGREQAGLDTQLGQTIQRRLDLARTRMQKLFEGSLATPALKLGAAGLSAPSLLGQAQTADIAA